MIVAVYASEGSDNMSKELISSNHKIRIITVTEKYSFALQIHSSQQLAPFLKRHKIESQLIFLAFPNSFQTLLKTNESLSHMGP